MTMKNILSHKIFYGLALAVAMFSAMPAAQAALVTYNYTITGYVTVGDEFDPNDYNLTGNLGLPNESITATGTFTADVGTIGNETGQVFFATGSGNTMTINLNGTFLYATDDSGYGTGIGPSLTFASGALFDFDFQKPGSPAFNSSFLFFDDFDQMFGDWTDLSLTVVPTAVPVPAAVWLFGSGLLGLMGMARRMKTRA
jgi:hypothetical protein